jgi:hypothetical protein
MPRDFNNQCCVSVVSVSSSKHATASIDKLPSYAEAMIVSPRQIKSNK